MNNNRYIKRLVRCDGGVAARVVVCAASLAVLAIAIIMLLKTFEARSTDDYRRVEIISAYGIEEALKKLMAEGFEWDEGFTDEPYPFDAEEDNDKDGVYSVTVTRETRNDTLYVKIVSTGKVGAVTHTQTVEHPIPAAPPSASETLDAREETGDGTGDAFTNKNPVASSEGK